MTGLCTLSINQLLLTRSKPHLFFNQIFMQLGQNVFPDESLDGFDNGSSGVKN